MSFRVKGCQMPAHHHSSLVLALTGFRGQFIEFTVFAPALLAN
jgi:hypothetical protein